MKLVASALLAVCCLASSASGQNGSDICSNAPQLDAISGFGTFPVIADGTTAFSPSNNCSNPVYRVVWFYWTSTFTGPVIVHICEGTISYPFDDTLLVVWPDEPVAGTCPGFGSSAIVCDDDACGLQSRVQFNAVAGDHYFLQWGNASVDAPFLGAFTITSPAPANDHCATPDSFSGSASRPFNNVGATTGAEGQGEALCNFSGETAIFKDAWWTWTPTRSGSVTLTTCGTTMTADANTKVAIYDGAGCPTAPAIACNDDDVNCTGATGNSTVTWTAVCGQAYTIQLGQASASAYIHGTFQITESGNVCITGQPFCFGTAASCPCGNGGGAGNGCASSVNAAGANLTATGNPWVSADTVVLMGSGMPNSSCLYFQGTQKVNQGNGIAFGDGLRCAGGTVIRLGTQSNVGGTSQYPSGSDPSVSVRGMVTPGFTFRYQAWYRNAAAFCNPETFNLTNGYQIAWQA